MSLRTVFTPESILNHVNALSRDGMHQQAYTYLIEHMEVFHDQRQLEAALNPLLLNVRRHLASIAPRLSNQAGITTPSHVYLVGQRSPVLMQFKDVPTAQITGRKSPVPDAYSDISADDAMMTARSNSSASGYHSPMERSPSRENNEMMAGVQIALAPMVAHPMPSSRPLSTFIPASIPTTVRSFTPTLNTSGPSTTSLVPSSLRGFPVFVNSSSSSLGQSPSTSAYPSPTLTRPTSAMEMAPSLPALSFAPASLPEPTSAAQGMHSHFEAPSPVQSLPHVWVDARSPRLAAIQESNPYAPEYEDPDVLEDSHSRFLGSSDTLNAPSSPPLSSSYALEAATASSSVSSFSTSTQYSSSTAYSNYSSAAYYTPSKMATPSKSIRHGNSAPSLTSAFSMALQTSHSPPANLQTSHSPPADGAHHFFRSSHSPLPMEDIPEQGHSNYFAYPELDVDGPPLADDFFWSQHLDS